MTAADAGAVATVREIAQAAGIPVDAELEVELISGGKSNLTYRVRTGRDRWIMRRPPMGDVARGAHDVAREYRVMQALADTGVPVPRMVGLVDPAAAIGLPAYVMQEVPGVVLRTRDQLEPISPDDRTRLATSLVETLADLHEVDPQSVGLSGLGRPDGFLQRQLDRWIGQLAKIREEPLDGAADVVDFLSAKVPQQSPAGIVHGDYRLDNVMVATDDPADIVAVLDWEMATVGDPMADLGMLLMFWDEPDREWNPITAGLMAFDGLPTAREAGQLYLSRRALSGDDLSWYVLFAQFKLAVIMEQIAVRHRRGKTRGEGFEAVVSMPATILRQAIETWHAGHFK